MDPVCLKFLGGFSAVFFLIWLCFTAKTSSMLHPMRNAAKDWDFWRKMDPVYLSCKLAWFKHVHTYTLRKIDTEFYKKTTKMCVDTRACFSIVLFPQVQICTKNNVKSRFFKYQEEIVYNKKTWFFIYEKCRLGLRFLEKNGSLFIFEKKTIISPTPSMILLKKHQNTFDFCAFSCPRSQKSQREISICPGRLKPENFEILKHFQKP